MAVVALLMAAMLAGAELSYVSSVEQWRRDREASLKADDGWLAVTGLFWLKEGRNTFGTEPSNDIVLPAGSAPAHAGVFELRNGRTTVRLGQEEKLTELKPDSPGLTLDNLTFQVIHRNQRYAIRLRDKNSKARKQFTKLRWYPVQESYRVTARFVAYPKPRQVAIPTVLGYSDSMSSPGYAVFRLKGYEWHLQPVLDESQLFFIFRDATSGKRTYPGGRFLYADLPKDGKVELDFNKAYNPPCAFTPYTTCPLPPRQNHLRVAVAAGELNYPQ